VRIRAYNLRNNLWTPFPAARRVIHRCESATWRFRGAATTTIWSCRHRSGSEAAAAAALEKSLLSWFVKVDRQQAQQQTLAIQARKDDQAHSDVAHLRSDVIAVNSINPATCTVK
jgi:hypothetical protein